MSVAKSNIMVFGDEQAEEIVYDRSDWRIFMKGCDWDGFSKDETRL